jgi:hypothetical protein
VAVLGPGEMEAWIQADSLDEFLDRHVAEAMLR